MQFQDETLLDKRKTGAIAALQEKKMAILESAIKELPQEESLWIAYMELASERLE
jgi:hypothetical protein